MLTTIFCCVADLGWKENGGELKMFSGVNWERRCSGRGHQFFLLPELLNCWDSFVNKQNVVKYTMYTTLCNVKFKISAYKAGDLEIFVG